jgi:hypothetical protein
MLQRTGCSNVQTEQKQQYIDGELLYVCGGKYEGSIVQFVKQLRVKVRVCFEDGENRDLMPTSVESYNPPIMLQRTRCSNVQTGQKQQYIDGERLYCCGGKYKGTVVQFVKQLRVKVRVRFEDGENRDLMPTSLESYIPPVQNRVNTRTLLAMVESSLAMQGLDSFDREGFLIVCEEIGRRAFA